MKILISCLFPENKACIYADFRHFSAADKWRKREWPSEDPALETHISYMNVYAYTLTLPFQWRIH